MNLRSLRMPRVAFVALGAMLTVLMTVVPAIADRPGAAAPDETHCVTDVVTQAADGELVVGAERCYGSFAEAMLDASDGAVALSASVKGDVMFQSESVQQLAAWFTLGIHYDGYNGTGSSITIKGSSCSGGYWNATGWWRNRISSSYNGCYHLKHHDLPNRAGSTYHTYTKYQIDNIAYWMNNRTESVSYWSY